MDDRTERRHPLRGLLVAQFLGAFNDNALKVFVALLAIRNLALAPGSAAFEAASQAEATKAFVALTLPLMLASLPAAMIADRISKRTLIVTMKLLEVGLMAAIAVGLYRFPDDPLLPFVVLACMGAQSALFSPAKYGILPEILPHERLSAGNALLEMWTMVAIIAGTAAAGPLSDLFAASGPWMVGAALTLLAVVGLAASIAVPWVPASGRGATGGTFRAAAAAIRSDRVLRLAILGSVYLWAIASLLGQNILVYAKATLGLSDSLAGLPLAVLGAGMAAGCLLAGRLSAGKVEYGLIPLGAVGMALITLTIGLLAPGLPGTLVLMVMLGAAGGLILVPIHAVIQWRAPAACRGAVIAVANLLVYAGILAGSLVAYGLAMTGVSPRGILLASALAVAAGTFWSLYLLPEAFLRLGFVLVTHSVYKLTVVHPERVPEKRGALLIPNHVSFIDGLIMLASVDRPIRFVIDSYYYNHPLLKPFMTSLRAIPITLSAGPKVLLRALRDAGEYLDQGELVCIFPEGQITRTGMLGPFQRGFQRIVTGRDVPIIPVALDRVWGSIFSRSGGRFVTKMPRRFPYPITVAFGEPLPPGTSISETRAAVRELATEAWLQRKADSQPLYKPFIHRARIRPWKFSMADARRPKGLSRFGALVGAIALGRALRGRWEGQQRVGILLPPSVGGALVNVAAALTGRTSVNLNYTAGRAGLTSAARQAGLRTVVTSGMFVAKAELELPEGVEPIWIEEVGEGIGRGARLIAALLAAFGTTRAIERACGSSGRPGPDDVATIIFSSGSTGEPKGVQLTHFNLESNVEAAAQVIQCGPGDVLLGILPFFHSFGYMATLWLVVNNGTGVVYHPNPLDAVAIGELVQRYRATVLIATPTFLQLYARRCTPGQFGSLRLVIAGAEKLPPALAQLFEDTFGLPVYEGYGATECAPAVALNAPDFRGPGYYQPGSRRGTVGQPLPGVSARIVDPESGERLPPGERGLILIKGPNLMAGYLGRDDLTAGVLRDGWYVTGDLGTLDDDGFLSITDRLARFSKIGGEMVPHGVIEQALHEAAEVEERTFVVTAIDDARKGERIVVVHTTDAELVPPLLERLQARGLPNLFIPRKDDFVKVAELPILGTGKTDLRAVKQVATDALG